MPPTSRAPISRPPKLDVICAPDVAVDGLPIRRSSTSAEFKLPRAATIDGSSTAIPPSDKSLTDVSRNASVVEEFVTISRGDAVPEVSEKIQPFVAVFGTTTAM